MPACKSPFNRRDTFPASACKSVSFYRRRGCHHDTEASAGAPHQDGCTAEAALLKFGRDHFFKTFAKIFYFPVLFLMTAKSKNITSQLDSRTVMHYEAGGSGQVEFKMQSRP